MNRNTINGQVVLAIVLLILVVFGNEMLGEPQPCREPAPQPEWNEPYDLSA